jgi:hypothetical protein
MSNIAAPSDGRPGVGLCGDAVPDGVDDPINAAILRVSEDRIAGFHDDPFAEIARVSGIDFETVTVRIRAMLLAGTVRRVRQTLLATSLAEGALVAWRVSVDRLDAAFQYLVDDDPFSGHVVVRSTDSATKGSAYRLWTTLKVPQGFSLQKHAELLQGVIHADSFIIMPAKRLFALGVGHLRRRDMQIGSRCDALADVIDTKTVTLSDIEWQVLVPLKRELTLSEISHDVWKIRAAEAGVDLSTFLKIGHDLSERGVIGRFSTFLEHVKPTSGDIRVTRYNALFHWRVPVGREIDAGREVGRFHIMTHAYWREGGSDFGNVNVMGVAHGLDKTVLLAHKQAIDEHLKSVGIDVLYTNVFWGGRSEIKPSEIAPQAYAAFCRERGIDPGSMRA